MASELVRIDYTNWRGERRWRVIYPGALRFGSTEWHPNVQWLLSATDMEDGKVKDFAMASIHRWEPSWPQDKELAR